MELTSFQMALWDSSLASGLLDGQEWNSHLSDAIKITPRSPLHPHAKLALWYTPELRQMKREIR